MTSTTSAEFDLLRAETVDALDNERRRRTATAESITERVWINAAFSAAMNLISNPPTPAATTTVTHDETPDPARYGPDAAYKD